MPPLQNPNFLLGTDNFGRDGLSRVIHAYRIDMQIAVFATVPAFVFGTLVGAFVGYAGGLAMSIFGRVVDAVVTFPFLVLVIAIVALVVIGPKDLPRVMRTVGGWVGRARGMARHFRSGLDTMMREAELEEMEKKWREENARILAEHPFAEPLADPEALAAPAELPAPDDRPSQPEDKDGPPTVAASPLP